MSHSQLFFFFEGSETTYSYADSVKDNDNKTVTN